MTADFTNQSKNSATIVNIRKYGIALWDDAVATWDDARFFWDNKVITFTNQAKHTANIINQTKH